MADTKCPRCNKTSTYNIVSSGPLFDGKYETVCVDCADTLDIEAARKDIETTSPERCFNVFGLLPPDSEEAKRMIRSERAHRTIEKARKAIDTLSKAIEKRKKG